jgi:gluconate kinase
MKLTEAKQILKKSGAKLVKESHEDDIRTNNEAFSFLYKLKNDFEKLCDRLDSKAKDYINGHVSDNDWEAFLWENGQKIRLNSIRMGKIGEVLKTLVNR